LLRPLFSAGDQSGAQSPAQGRSDEAPDAIFHTETNLALVSFQVVTTRNRFVEDLRAAEIELLEDGVPQKVALFEGGRLSGMEVHVMFDCSGSMWSSKWSKGVFDPRVFDANLLDEFPNVRIGIWGFTGSGLGYFTTPTRDPVKLGDAISGLSGMPPGSTPLYSSLVSVARRFEASPGESARLIVVISDGRPYADEATQADAASAARSAGIPIYSVLVGLLRYPDAQQFSFERLGSLTGGRAFEFTREPPDDLLGAVLKRLAGQIRYRYTAGYYPASTGESGVHKVQVVLKSSRRGTVVGGVKSVQH
jgi:Ca-activated chloride channel family protein